MAGAASGDAHADFDVVVRRERMAAHLARARLHGQAAKLLNASGEPYGAWAPLDAPPPFGLKYQ
eukprot:scaffold34362_cov39-Isochrysis_galbana.AAC.1